MHCNASPATYSRSRSNFNCAEIGAESMHLRNDAFHCSYVRLSLAKVGMDIRLSLLNTSDLVFIAIERPAPYVYGCGILPEYEGGWHMLLGYAFAVAVCTSCGCCCGH